jgi:hypothetical protein
MNVTKATWVCAECDREFDMLNTADAEEWFYGHDCETPASSTGDMRTT